MINDIGFTSDWSKCFGSCVYIVDYTVLLYIGNALSLIMVRSVWVDRLHWNRLSLAMHNCRERVWLGKQ